MLKVSLAITLLLACLSTAHGWGREGHHLIGALAETQLSAESRAEVARLLEGEPEPTLAGVSSWADSIRDDQIWRWTAPLHYVKMDDARCKYSAERNCRNELCVVGAIERYSRVLADGRQPDASRREALKFLVHFVGDIHQPLHAGYREDRGGNDFQINIDGQGTNLHSVWDSRLLGPQAGGRTLPAHPGSGQSVPARLHGVAEQWASESCRLTDADGFYPQRPGRLPAGYLHRFQRLASERIALAGARLAAILEDLLAPKR